MKIIDDNFEDYFESNTPKKVNAPHVETEEEREERELNETTIERRSNKKRLTLIVGSLVFLLFLIFFVRCRYYNPEICTIKGQVVDITLRGSVFKTYEGTLKPITVQMEGTTVEKEFKFSVTNDSIAKKLSELKQTPIPVELKFRKYKGRLPWRGETKCIVDSVNLDINSAYVEGFKKSVASTKKQP